MKAFRLSLILAMTMLLGNFVFAQAIVDSPEYESLKSQGLIEQPAQVTPVAPVQAILPASNGSRSLGLYVPLDGTFTQVSFLPDYTGGSGFYSDDGSTAEITLPFTFCFYGTNETSFFINNNGNVSFDGSYSTFTSSGFPVSGFPMLAPFWADVDTRTGLGAVWMKMTASSVTIIWDFVGYYGIHGDLRNTFELIFTNGTDPLIGVGNNVAFSFGDMQWTTGDASSGIGGFGGTPATVGVNRGNGVNYALVGRFDKPGNAFDGAGGNNDGIDYLDNTFYTFDACIEDVVIPPLVPISNWALFIGIGLILVAAVIRFRRLI
jgi:hypothetical protein